MWSRITQMIRIERSIVIHKPLESVFSWFVDIPYGVELRPGMRAARRLSAEPVGLGTVVEVPMPPSWIGVALRWAELRITELKPNEVFAYVSESDDFPYRWRYRFEPIQSGTLITEVFEEDVTGFIRRRIERLLAKLRDKQVDEALTSQKQRLESELP
jgi:ligand-binding SRPBCC domain-containing protein